MLSCGELTGLLRENINFDNDINQISGTHIGGFSWDPQLGRGKCMKSFWQRFPFWVIETDMVLKRYCMYTF